jgi:hypothetical protein
MQKLKLEMELVPKNQWLKSLYSSISKSKWTKIRQATIEEQNNRCKVCGAQGTLYCHEIWEYDDNTSTQKLEGFEALCHACNAVRHFGKSQDLALQGRLDIKGVIRHFLEVNSCDRKTFFEFFILLFTTQRVELILRHSDFFRVKPFVEYALHFIL